MQKLEVRKTRNASKRDEQKSSEIQNTADD
jgi:hypothetical protein